MGLYLKPFDNRGEAKPFIVAPAWQMVPRFSPDGKYLAYMTTESGQPQVWVASLAGTGRWRVADGRCPAGRRRVLRAVYGFDVTSDGQRFVVAKANGTPGPLSVEVLYGWTAALRRP